MSHGARGPELESLGTPTEEIKIILNEKKISHFFSDVFGSPTNKIEHIYQILDKYSYKPDELLFYGDSQTDLDAAKFFKIPFILIKNEFNKSMSNNIKSDTIVNFNRLI